MNNHKAKKGTVDWTVETIKSNTKHPLTPAQEAAIARHLMFRKRVKKEEAVKLIHDELFTPELSIKIKSSKSERLAEVFRNGRL